MRIPKGGTPLPPAIVRAEGEHTEFNKTTEAQNSQRKSTTFGEGKRQQISHKLRMLQQKKDARPCVSM